MMECFKNKKGDGNPGDRAESSLVAPPDMAAPTGVTSGIGGGQSASMQSLVAKSKRYLQMFSLV